MIEKSLQYNNNKIVNKFIEREYGYVHFDDVLYLVLEIVIGCDPYNIIRIPKLNLSKLGYSDEKIFEDEVLSVIFNKVEKITGIDIDEIKMKMKHKIEYV